MKIPVYMEGQDRVLRDDELYQAMEEDLSDNGWQTPQQTTADITNIASSMRNGTMWYDTDTDELKVKVAGVVRVLQLV